MGDFLTHLFDTADFPARWHCGQWSTAHGWLHVLSDVAIFGAYAAIPIAITFFVVRRRSEVPFTHLYWLFAAFILACGFGHLIEATIFWHPWYRLSGAVKLITAVVSWATVVAIIKYLPAALHLPAAARLNAQLQQEVEERKRAETEVHRLNDDLRHRVEELQTLLDVLPVGIGIATDPECRKIRTNPAFARMLALPLAANASKSAPPEEAPRHFDIYQDGRRLAPEDLPIQTAARQGTVIRDYEEEILFNDGRTLYLVGYAAPLFAEQGRIRGSVGAFIDITARKQAEAERMRIERRLQDMQKLESLGVLAGGIAHDFNNLLTGIMGHTALARSTLLPDDPALRSLEKVDAFAARAADLCKQMLAYSGKGQFVLRTLNLSDLVRDSQPLVTASISRKVEVRFQLEPNLPPVFVDVTQLRQVLLNLVINASESFGEQIGTITVSTGRRRLDRAAIAETVLSPDLPEGEYVFLSVTDAGCGMAPETITRIFDPFFSTKFVGRGLGLAAVLGIARGHKAPLRVQSAPARGSTFTLYLPCAPAEPKPTPPPSPGPAMPHAPSTVLVIDDEEAVRSVVAASLPALGMQVVLASNGREGVSTFQADPHRYALVLLDLTMPEMNGYQAFRELRRCRPDVRVVLMTGFDSSDAASVLLHEGLAGFLQKPFDPETLQQTLRGVLAKDPTAPATPPGSPPS
jgi:signal transduction histidine kinase/ActR/RegA family two-component response regulator